MNRDIEFMRSPAGWPLYPLLPVKRPSRSDGAELGLMVYDDFCTVFLLHLDDLPKQPYRDLAEMKEKHPQINYSSTEELAADGWIVD